MSVASLATMGRLRPALGPALGKAPFPFTATVLSALLHVTLGVGIVLGARAWAAHQPKLYIVNLAPAIAAVGAPPGEADVPPPALPPRDAERPRPPAPMELPQRETARATLPDLPARARDLALPDRALPDRALDRAPATPRPGDKELPTIASSAAPRDVAIATPRRAAAPPPAPLGQLTGSPQGSGAVTLNVTDFPYAWYMNAIVRKVTERWVDRALQGRQPVALVEIGRDGQIRRLSIEKTSGNPYYDQAALRAITESNPFPPLPTEYKEPVLRVHFGFNFAPDRG